MFLVLFQVWNFQNGHNLHKLEPVSEAEVTGILPYFDRKMILAVGWGRKIIRYDDSDPDVNNSYNTAYSIHLLVDMEMQINKLIVLTDTKFS